MNEGTPLIHLDYTKALQAFRDITNSTNENTFISAQLPESAVGHTVSLVDYEHARSVASALVLANMNSLPLDWVARLSVGGTHMSFFIVKQLPILPPEAYLEKVRVGSMTYAELVVPKVLELTYTADSLGTTDADTVYNANSMRSTHPCINWTDWSLNGFSMHPLQARRSQPSSARKCASSANTEPSATSCKHTTS